MSSQARREAFRAVPETCPAVDKALADAERVIKDQTEALREALIEALERAIEAESECESLRDKIARLENQIADLECDLREANALAAA